MSRNTAGTDAPPPNIEFHLAAWLTIWSIASTAKSTRGCVTIGRSPHNAAPTAAPVHASSLTGVSMTRAFPNSFSRSRIVLPTYHGLQSPWPRTMTESSSSRT